MKISKKQKDKTLFVTIEGDIVLTDTDKLAGAFYKITLMKEIHAVVFHMKTVNSITASAIGEFLKLYKFLKDNCKIMEINGVSVSVYDKFLEIHTDRLFPIHR